MIFSLKIKLLVISVTLCFVACGPPYRGQNVKIIDTYKEFGLLKGGQSKTIIEYPNGARKVVDGQLGKKGETIKIFVHWSQETE